MGYQQNNLKVSRIKASRGLISSKILLNSL